MAKLKNKNAQVPFGFRFHWAATKWDAQKVMPYRSFDHVVKALQSHVRGNMHQAQQSGMSADYDSLAALVEQQTVMALQKEGYTDFITEEASTASPKQIPQHPLRPRPQGAAVVKSMAVGASLYAGWLGQGGKPVARGVAESRAAVCVACPNNKEGDWKTFFTEQAAALILKTLELKNDMELSTSVDEKLGLCSVCLCPLKAKSWVPLPHVKAHTSAKALSELPSPCWIKDEIAASNA